MKLFEAFNINGKLSLKNRIVMPALVTRLVTEDGEITGELLDRYLLYAKGGTGLAITEAISVRKRKSGALLRLSEDRFVPALKELTDRVAVARPTLCDPHWPRKTVEGREQDILRCLYCNKCKEADEAFQKVYCVQWKKEGRTMVPPYP
jgi:2,4-dienoyl-CoA reductase-like NADH-dependent reductase (Old Yellow Enzyme family)